MRCIMVSHTHWDREWYRTFQTFRARLVDTVDRVLELVDEDPGYHFQLDGQSIVVEDYLAIRPEQRERLMRAVKEGRIAIGPWYVQPDSLLPGGETHVRNLLEGRRVAEALGGSSTIAYTPDSFGHPAQFPQMFAGFGLEPFVYWRGNGSEIDKLPAEYRWVAPDGSSVRACHLGRGYFPAWGLGRDVPAAVARLRQLGLDLAERSENDRVLMMNGIDHMLPDHHTAAIARALAEETGWEVERGLLDAFVDGLPDELPRFEGELVGGRLANLLPGVWSTRTYLKLQNRRCETALIGWAEPWVALGRALGAPDESPSLRLAWREVLPNQAHDSLCGCSQDRVHDQMESRTDSAEELARETLDRTLERIAGLGLERQLTADEDGTIELAVFNPSGHPRTDVVRLALDGHPAFTARGIHPLLLANADASSRGFFVDGVPARVVPHDEHVRAHLSPDQPVHDLEFVVHDVPAFGWQRVALTRGNATQVAVDDGREIEAAAVRVEASEDGTLRVTLGDLEVEGLCGLEDTGDRGDSYDFDPVGEPECRVAEVAIERHRHPGGIQTLRVRRVLEVPARLDATRERRSRERVALPVEVEARVAPGVERVDLRVELDNRAEDHRLRLLFPTGHEGGDFEAATTFDVARRRPGPSDDAGWIHPAPPTFPQQGFVAAGGLCIGAPGLVEAEVSPAGVVALTLVRAVGWLSRPDLTTRPGEAGPSLPTPGAQCPGPLVARLSLSKAGNPAAARDAELGLRAVGAGPQPRLEPGRAALEIAPPEVQLSSLKPAEDGHGVIVRLLNPTDHACTARIRNGLELGKARCVRLDEQPLDAPLERDGGTLRVPLPAHAMRSLRLELG